MISSRERGLFQLFGTVQMAAASAGFVVFYLVNDLVRGGWASSPVGYFKCLLVMLVAMCLEMMSREGDCRVNAGKMSRRQSLALARRQVLWVFGALAVFYMLSRDQTISRVFLLMYVGLLWPLLYLTHRHGRRLILMLTPRGSLHWRLKAQMVGSREWCAAVRSHLDNVGDLFELEPPIFTDEETDENLVYERLKTRGFDVLIFTSTNFHTEMVSRILALGDRSGFRCWLPLNLSLRHGRRFESETVGGLTMMMPPPLPLSNTFNRALKRAFDVVLSLGLLTTVVLPFAAVVAMIHRRYSPGPLLFRQQRIGENGRVFEILKFRTMYVANDDESRQATRGDSRIFRFGGALRKYSLDELPQFLNVLRGDMSVIGPRPHMVSHERQFEDCHELYGGRRFVKPGITGLAQVHGFRGEIVRRADVRARARYDLLYARKWCLGLDFRLAAMTALKIINPHRSAY